MLTSFVGWFKGLSILGKTLVVVTGSSVAGAATMPSYFTTTNQDSGVQGQTIEKPSPKITTEETTETEPILYSKTSVETESLAKGTTKITTQGVNGTRTIKYKITFTDGVQTNKEQVDSQVTTQPVDEVTSIGTYVKQEVSNSCDPNYSPCIPNVSYDLDCPDIGFTVRVLGSDPHRLDRDNDGYGCE